MGTRMPSGERRRSIVASAIHLFAEKGFRGTTTRELAGALGVSEPVLYQHFATKRDLYTAIIEAKAEQGRGLSAGLREQFAGSDDRAFFERLAELILRHSDEDPEFLRLLMFGALERHELARRFYAGHIVQFHDLVAGYIRRRIKEGAFRRVNPNLAARSFIGMVNAYASSHVLFGEPAKANNRKLIRELADLFLEGVARR
jgi:AcrR family transcriptional regulator